MNKHLQKGQTLVEVILALGVFSIVVVALVTLATTSLRNAQESIRRSEAPKLANAGVEASLFWKNALPEGLNNSMFPASGDPSHCYAITGDGTTLTIISSNCNSNPAASWVDIIAPSNLLYERQIKITRLPPPNDTTAEVVTTVRWQDAQGFRTVVIPRRMTTWR